MQKLDNKYVVVVVTLAMFVAAMLAHVLVPTHVVDRQSGTLDSLIPSQFGSWSIAKDSLKQVSLFAVDENGNNPMQDAYDDSLLRTYSRADGTQIMLAIAYDRIQREENRVHRPEICYIAQGFSILQDHEADFHLTLEGSERMIEGRRMLARSGNRLEAVAYWIRVGDVFTQNPWKSRAYVLTEGLVGRLHDGVLVRTSQIIRSPQEFDTSLMAQEKFLDQLVRSVQPAGQKILANTATPGPG